MLSFWMNECNIYCFCFSTVDKIQNLETWPEELTKHCLKTYHLYLRSVYLYMKNLYAKSEIWPFGVVFYLIYINAAEI